MRWLLDQGLPRSAGELLREAGMDAVHVGELGMAEASDHEILAHADREKRILVTFDSDFHAIFAISGAALPSVIRIREEGLKGSAIAQLIIGISRQFSETLEGGCVITLTTTQARLRRLPISL